MNKVRIVCFGDSITQGAGLAEADRWTAQLAFQLERYASDVFSVFNRGVGGDTTALALDRYKTDILPLLPATVLIEFGLNDCYVYPWCRRSRVGLVDYSRNLGEIVHALRRDGGMPILVVNHPVCTDRKVHRQGNRRTVQQNLADYTAAARKLAVCKNIPCIDLPGALRAARVDPAALLSEDRLHLSAIGNRIYARLLMASLTQVAPGLFSACPSFPSADCGR